MSIFHKARATCSSCGETAEVDLVASVNADRRPDLRQAILDRNFQATTCPKCSAQMRLTPHLSYLDLGRGQWILVEGGDKLEDWETAEAEARITFDRSFGPDAPPSARDLGAGLAPRIVFGWPALREKLVCQDLSLEDTVLELLKVAILRNVPDSPLADQTELRLSGETDGNLRFTWIETATEKPISGIEVPREIYDGVAGDEGSWAAIRAKLDGGLFVDFKRLLIA